MATQIQDTLYTGSGALAAGKIRITGTKMDAGGKTVVVSTTEVTLVAGVIDVTLETTPGVTYTARYYLTDGTNYSEVWIVPISATPVKVSDLWTSLSASSVTGVQKIAVLFDNVTEVSILGPTHGLGVNPTVDAIYDDATPRNLLEAGSITVDASGNVTITFGEALSGTVILGGSRSGSGQYIATFSGVTAVTISAATHGLGLNPVLVGCRDSSGAEFEPGSVTVDASGNITITFGSAVSGKVILR